MQERNKISWLEPKFDVLSKYIFRNFFFWLWNLIHQEHIFDMSQEWGLYRIFSCSPFCVLLTTTSIQVISLLTHQFVERNLLYKMSNFLRFLHIVATDQNLLHFKYRNSQTTIISKNVILCKEKRFEKWL